MAVRLDPGQAVKVDNTEAAFAAKVALRWAVVDALGLQRPAQVLDAFAGHGRLWRHVAARAGRVEVTAIERKASAHRAIHADNRRVLGALAIHRFDVVDLDAYGIPAEQAQLVAAQQYQGPVIWTAISVGMGTLPRLVVESEGIPWEWADEARTVVAGFSDPDEMTERWCAYLGRLGWAHHVVLTPTSRTKLYGCSNPPVGLDRSAILDRWHQMQDPHTQEATR